MEIHHTARKHGIDDDDILHAFRRRLYEGRLGQDRPWRVLYLGPDRAGNLLEVVTIERNDGTELVIHAMKMRKRYRQLLAGGGPQDG